MANLNPGTAARPQSQAGRDADAALRAQLESLLGAGLQTRWLERAYTSEDVNRVVAELQALPREAYAERMRVAGFTLHAYAAEDIAQSCATCMYYEMHRQFCALPELMLPVRAEWSCSLWRI